MRRCRLQLITLIAASAVACTMGRDVASEVSTTSVTAVAPANGQAPFRTTSEGDASNLMLFGHDPVTYFTENRAVKGDPQHSAEHLGVTYWFASAANRDLFLADPDAYMPQFGGYCANGINYAIPGGGGGGPNTWRIYQGRLYVFGGQSSRDHFEMDTVKNLQLAHHYWETEVRDANPTWTRLRRMVLRVPHYRSDASLQEEWESKRDAGTLPVMPGQPQVLAP